MKFSLSKVNWEGRWFDFKNGIRLKIKPIPRSRMNFLVTAEGIKFDGIKRLEDFKYCLLEIEGLELEDQNGKPLQLTELVKAAIFDCNWEGIGDFVDSKSSEMLRDMAESEKN